MATYKEINKFVRKKGNESKRILSTNLKKLGKVSSGQTLNSLEVRFFTTASNFGFRLLASPVIDFIDQGRKPGGKMPPPGSMIEWIKRKGLTGINAKGKPIPITSLEYVMRRSIAIKGIPATNILSKTFDPFTKDIDDNLETFFKKDIESDFQDNLKKI